jgi:uncharacterized membrane protein YphA (DoxX/SURF4 family)
MAGEPDSGLPATIQDTTDWGVLLLLRVVAGLPLVFFGVLHLVSPHLLRDILGAAGLPLLDLHCLLVPLVEILAGVLLLVGLLTRVGAVLAFCVLVPALLVTLQVTAGRDGPAVPTLALPVTLAVASFFLALLGGGSGSIDQRMNYRRAAPARTAAGPRALFRWSGSDTVVVVLGLLILVLLMYFIWGRPRTRELSDLGVRADFTQRHKENHPCL